MKFRQWSFQGERSTTYALSAHLTKARINVILRENFLIRSMTTTLEGVVAPRENPCVEEGLVHGTS